MTQSPPIAPPTDPGAHLAALLRAVQTLGAMDLPPDAQALVAGAIKAARALADVTAPPPIVDRATFDGLLDLAGPQVAPELLGQLDRDLAEIFQALAAALDRDDGGSVRKQTHVLMALAGSFGARPLYAAAERLNRAAHGDHADKTSAGRDSHAASTDVASPNEDRIDRDRADGRAVLSGLVALRRFLKDAQPPPPSKRGI